MTSIIVEGRVDIIALASLAKTFRKHGHSIGTRSKLISMAVSELHRAYVKAGVAVEIIDPEHALEALIEMDLFNPHNQNKHKKLIADDVAIDPPGIVGISPEIVQAAIKKLGAK